MSKLETMGSVYAACKASGVNASAVYNQINQDLFYRQQVEFAKAVATGILERSAYKRAVYGHTKVLPDGTVRYTPPSDKLALEWLKVHSPEWREASTKRVEMQGSVRVAHAIDLTDAQLMAIAAQGLPAIDSTDPLEIISNDVKQLEQHNTMLIDCIEPDSEAKCPETLDDDKGPNPEDRGRG